MNRSLHRLVVGVLLAMLLGAGLVPAQAAPTSAQRTQVVTGGLWGLDRIDQRKLPLDTKFDPVHTGKGINVYIFDTGIEVDNPDFGGRASVAYDPLGGDGRPCPDAVKDPNNHIAGHGTYLAGLVGGKTYGVLKDAELHSVHVADCNGYVDPYVVWKALHEFPSYKKPMAIAILPFSIDPNPPTPFPTPTPTPLPTSLAKELSAVIASGVFVVTFAAEKSTTTCAFFPANVPEVYTVAATDPDDNAYGPSSLGCVHSYAPGIKITSDWPEGTSQSDVEGAPAAFAAGIAGLYKERYGDKPAKVVGGWLDEMATPKIVNGVPSGVPNRLLYTGGL